MIKLNWTAMAIRPPFVLMMWLAPCVLAWCSGCSITGSWRRVAVDPPGVPFPVDLVTFGKDHSYAAKWSENGSPRTSTGRYESNPFSLRVHPYGRQPRTYRLRRRLDGKLELIYRERDKEVTAVLERTDPQGNPTK